MATRVKTFTYQTSVEWKDGVEGTLGAPGKPNVAISAPPEFRGPEGRWAPEHLYIASVEACLLFTFLSLARARKLDLVSYKSEAEGLLEPVYGKLVVSKVTVKPRIVVKTEQGLRTARKIAEEIEGHCFISNSIESEVIIEPEISAEMA